MPVPTEKQIWTEVLKGNSQTATTWSKSKRSQQKQTKTTQNPTALYLEPSLSSTNGHQLTLAGCYKQLLKTLGYQTTIAHALNNSLEQKEHYLPYFLVKHHTMACRSINSLSDLKNVDQYFLNEFEQIIEEYDPSICIFPTIRFTNIVAAAKSLTAHKAQNVIFGVMEAAEVPDCDDPGIVQSAFIRAATLLQEHGLAHLLIAETDHVKTFLLKCGFQEEHVRVFPYVAARLITDIPRPAKNIPKNIQVGYLGGSRPVRHPELIADLLVSEPLPDNIYLSVQLDLNYIKNKRGQQICEAINEMHSNGSITLYGPNLSNQQYRSLFCSLDFVILPYGKRYQQIGSGILLEAIYAGTIPIFPADSKMNDKYTSLGGNAPCFTSLSTDEVKEAIINGVLRYSALRENAKIIREQWRKHPSSTEHWESELTNWLPTHG